MAGKVFVGRQDELGRFKQVLAEPEGQAVVVVGQAGMGKTWLVNRMPQIAENHPDFKCGTVRYEVTPTDSVDTTMALMMDDAFEASRSIKEGVKITGKNKERWKALLGAVGLIPVVGEKAKALGELVISLQRDVTGNSRAQFLRALEYMSKRMPENGRAVFIIDPEKYMEEKSDQSWALVVRDLPDYVKYTVMLSSVRKCL